MSASSPRRKRTPRSSAGLSPPDAGAWVASVVEEKPVGYVCWSLKRSDGATLARDIRLPGDRAEIRDRSTTVGMHLLRRLLREVGEGAHFEPTFRCEFGSNITVGANFYANFDCVMLDGGRITIGDNVLLGPRVSIYTSNHAMDAEERVGGALHA